MGWGLKATATAARTCSWVIALVSCSLKSSKFLLFGSSASICARGPRLETGAAVLLWLGETNKTTRLLDPLAVGGAGLQGRLEVLGCRLIVHHTSRWSYVG